MFNKLKIKLMLKLLPLQVLWASIKEEVISWKPLVLTLLGIVLCVYAMFSISFILLVIGAIMICHNWKES